MRRFGGCAPVRPLLRQRRERLGVRRGAQHPLASPNVLHWVGWLPGTTRCGAGPAVPAPQQEARLDPFPPLPGNATACRVPITAGEVPSQPPPPPSPRLCGTNSMVSSRDRLSHGPGSLQVTDYSYTYGRIRMPVDRMGGQWKNSQPCRKRSCPACRRTSFPRRILRLVMIVTGHP